VAIVAAETPIKLNPETKYPPHFFSFLETSSYLLYYW